MPTLIYLGTDEGVRTLRGGDGHPWTSHVCKTPEWPVEEIGVPRGHPGVVLAGTSGDGVWISEDYGQTFSKPEVGRSEPTKVRCLTFDPLVDSRVYAGCDPIDVFASDDLGRSWSRLDTVRDHPWVATVTYPGGNAGPHVRDIAIDPSDPAVIYVALQVGSILKTIDGARTWSVLGGGVDADVHTIAIDPSDSRHVVVATGGHDSRHGAAQGKALYTSSDAGESWTPVALNFYQDYAIPLVLTPGKPDVMFSALAKDTPGGWRRESGSESVLIKSVDGGNNWTELDTSSIAGFSKSFTAAIAVDPGDDQRVFAALTSGALLVSEDAGQSWSSTGIHQPGTNDIKCIWVSD